MKGLGEGQRNAAAVAADDDDIINPLASKNKSISLIYNCHSY